ncbi:hypothetical protein [Longimicrobium sp.]|jgi:hypothetical protein|uniref:hypothetical protein n=1 Tax=Longimicrobium sp. TaxID=2029185 RepID=UPI002EDAF2CD
MTTELRRNEHGQEMATYGVWGAHEGRWVATGPWDEKEAWWALLGTESLRPMLLEVRLVNPPLNAYDEALEDGDVPCPKCDGEGFCSECERECLKCDGSGYISAEEYERLEKEKAARRARREKRRKEMADQLAAKP